MGFVKLYALDLESVAKGVRPGVIEESAYRGMAMGLVLKKYRAWSVERGGRLRVKC